MYSDSEVERANGFEGTVQTWLNDEESGWKEVGGELDLTQSRGSLCRLRTLFFILRTVGSSWRDLNHMIRIAFLSDCSALWKMTWRRQKWVHTDGYYLAARLKTLFLLVCTSHHVQKGLVPV